INTQQVIDGLAGRLARARQAPVECMLGLNPLPRRGGGCSVCTVLPEFELDRAVARLINAGAFNSTGLCPYQVITSHLVAGLLFGPETFRAKGAGQCPVDPVAEIKAPPG